MQNKMLNLPAMKEQLKDRALSVVAKESGVSVPILRGIRDGSKGSNHTMLTLKKLNDYIHKKLPTESSYEHVAGDKEMPN